MRAAIFGAFLALSGAAFADSHQTTITSHGISAFGELKYPPDFPHFDYVNPEAPKGGTMSFRGFLASQTFDSLNQFILAGEPAQGLGLIYDTLLVRAFDEADAVYGLVAESIAYPEDRSSVIFTLRMGFINLRGFKHAIDVVRGKFDNPDDEGEISHFRALTSALYLCQIAGGLFILLHCGVLGSKLRVADDA